MATDKQISSWFEKRFGRKPEHDISYYQEWQHRFSGGTPYAKRFMDSRSLQTWNDMFSKKRKR